MTSTSQWSMLKGENNWYPEFVKAQANLRANILAGKGNTFAYTGIPGTSPLPITMAYLKGIPLADARNADPRQYVGVSQFTSSSWYNNLNYYNPSVTGMTGTGTSGLQNGIGTGTGLDANRIAAGLPINFFMPNPTVAQGNAYLETTGGSTHVQLDADRVAPADERRVPHPGQLRVPVRSEDVESAVAARGLLHRAQHGRPGPRVQGQLGV